ncbi:hypothetical protein GWI33_005485 [Rhynchophorus ferrugineus]|uniref:Uncharacterized protein n=1 Tax=Rhynchophorus ferrugineus TaxID=354439 RepID=A0A834MDS0_RHYFE|nr:hypothetical protein GWI33_005485 [Rhynchophorus ferrugineus]
MVKTQLFFAVFLLWALLCPSRQYVPAPTCFGQPCPSSTNNCKQHKRSSPDKSRIQITISCLDDYDSTIKDYYFEEHSSLSPYTHYENTKYESINQYNPNPYRSNNLELTPYHGVPEYF